MFFLFFVGKNFFSFSLASSLYEIRWNSYLFWQHLNSSPSMGVSVGSVPTCSWAGFGWRPESDMYTGHIPPRICWHLAHGWEVKLEIKGESQSQVRGGASPRLSGHHCCSLVVVRSQGAGSEALSCGSKLISLPLWLCSLSPWRRLFAPEGISATASGGTVGALCGLEHTPDGPGKTEFQTPPHLSSLWGQQWEPLAQ